MKYYMFFPNITKQQQKKQSLFIVLNVVLYTLFALCLFVNNVIFFVVYLLLYFFYYRIFLQKYYKKLTYKDEYQIFGITLTKSQHSLYCQITLIYYNKKFENVDYDYIIPIFDIFKITKKYNFKKLTEDDILYIIYCTCKDDDVDFLSEFTSTPDYLIKRHRKQKIKDFI